MLLLLACTSPEDSAAPAQQDPTVGPALQVSPGPGMPAEVVDQPAHNNLDVIRHDGRVYLALRTAPDHFASAHPVIYVVSSEDQETWRYETSFWLGTDLREPRFFAWEGTLTLYFAVLGDDPFDFQPQGTMRSTLGDDGAWSEPTWWRQDGFIPWRINPPYLIGYTEGGAIYDTDELPQIPVEWLKTANGVDWEAAVPGQAVVATGGSSETAWAPLDDGGIVAVMRNEAGDEQGWGSNICRAEADTLGDWTCVNDPKKYDSPMMVKVDGRFWLFGRRNVTDDGYYDLGYRDRDFSEQTLAYEAAYWVEPKRCSLWEVDPGTLGVRWVLDLESRGDTCFASGIDEGDGSWTIYNYSSPIDGPDLDWIEGQNGETYIYKQTLQLP